MNNKKHLLCLAFVLLAAIMLGGCQSGSQANGKSTGSGSIVTASAERFSGKNDKVRVRIETSEKTELTVSLDDGSSKTRNCNNQCQLVFNKVSAASGTVTITNGKDVVEVSYSANQ